MTQDAARQPHGRTLGGVLYTAADTALFIGLLNLLMVTTTLAGGVVLGLAPALSAAATVSRARLHGDGAPVIRAFLRAWASSFAHANALLAAPIAVSALLAVDAALLARSTAWGIVFAIALAVAIVYTALLVNMDAHYALRKRDAVRLAARFLLASPASGLLLAATIALVAALTWFIPGLLPVVSIAAASHLGTALCLSFFAANDDVVSA